MLPYVSIYLELSTHPLTVNQKFDACSRNLGPIRQNVFACLTCNPPPASPAQVYTPAGVCYSCSISCHGEHTLVELFARRNFVCDCGSTRIPSTPCLLRLNVETGRKGVQSEEAPKDNQYNHNFQNKFCSCNTEYVAEEEKGTMFQCLGLGTLESGGCGEDWWHPECLMGLPRDWHKASTARTEELKPEPEDADDGVDDASQPVPPGFPDEEDFDGLVCYKCVEASPWIKSYAGTEGFLSPVFNRPESREEISQAGLNAEAAQSLKRKASDDDDDDDNKENIHEPVKRFKDDSNQDITSLTPDAKPLQLPQTTTIPPTSTTTQPPQQHKHTLLPPPPTPTLGPFTLFLTPTFRDALCHCPSCFSQLLPHPQLLDEESIYAPSVSDSNPSNPNSRSASPAASIHSTRTGNSLYSLGEAALNNVDRVRAIEGVMAYNHLRDKVKEFLKPYAESGRVVGAEDVKRYFEKLRGDEGGKMPGAEGIGEGSGGGGGKENGDDGKEGGQGGPDESAGGDGRREQSGY